MTNFKVSNKKKYKKKLLTLKRLYIYFAAAHKQSEIICELKEFVSLRKNQTINKQIYFTNIFFTFLHVLPWKPF